MKMCAKDEVKFLNLPNLIPLTTNRKLGSSGSSESVSEVSLSSLNRVLGRFRGGAIVACRSISQFHFSLKIQHETFYIDVLSLHCALYLPMNAFSAAGTLN